MFKYLIGLTIIPLMTVAASAQPLKITNEITTDTLAVDGNYQYGPYAGGSPSYWVLEREVTGVDARALNLVIGAPKGTKAWMEIQSINGTSSNGNAGKGKKNKKDKKKDKKKKRNIKAGASWYVDFQASDGKLTNILEIKASDSLVKSGVGFFLPDACNAKTKYLIRVVLDFRAVDVADPASMDTFKNIPPSVALLASNPPQSQATLFKFPSEKDPGSAVILMQTNGANPEYIHFTYSKNGVPVNMNSFQVDQYFFSGNGLFTRLYLGGSYLSGGRVSMHHLSADYTANYSVCVTLNRQRQELEGYH